MLFRSIDTDLTNRKINGIIGVMKNCKVFI